MVELKLFLMPPLKRSGRVKAFLEILPGGWRFFKNLVLALTRP